MAVSVSAVATSLPLGSVAGSVNPSLRPGVVIALYHGSDLITEANLLFGLYPSTTFDEAKLTYQETQSPFAEPMSVLVAVGLALMNTSPLSTLPLMSVTRAVEPAPTPVTE